MALIVGAGAVGTILAGYLARAKRPVRMYIREKDLDAFQHAQQLLIDRVTGGPPLKCSKPALTTKLDLAGERHVFICVKYPALDAVLDALPTPLPENLTLVSTLNGVGALRRIRERFPEQPTAGMTIMFNAQLLEPLHARITTKPQVLINSDDRELLQLFDGSGMQVKQAGSEAAAWGKLLINLANAICACTHTTFKDLLTDRDLRRVYVRTLDEAVRTLEAAGVDYELPLPLPYRAYRYLLLFGGPLPWWFARLRNGLQAGSYPSMVADVVTGRRTEVDQLNGEIVALGQRCEVPTPINAQLVELVETIAAQTHPDFLTPAELRRALGL